MDKTENKKLIKGSLPSEPMTQQDINNRKHKYHRNSKILVGIAVVLFVSSVFLFFTEKDIWFFILSGVGILLSIIAINFYETKAETFDIAYKTQVNRLIACKPYIADNDKGYIEKVMQQERGLTNREVYNILRRAQESRAIAGEREEIAKSKDALKKLFAQEIKPG